MKKNATSNNDLRKDPFLRFSTRTFNWKTVYLTFSLHFRWVWNHDRWPWTEQRWSCLHRTRNGQHARDAIIHIWGEYHQRRRSHLRSLLKLAWLWSFGEPQHSIEQVQLQRGQLLGSRNSRQEGAQGKFYGLMKIANLRAKIKTLALQIADQLILIKLV